jgi:hypothetical protein
MFSMIVMMDNSTFGDDSSWLCDLYLIYIASLQECSNNGWFLVDTLVHYLNTLMSSRTHNQATKKPNFQKPTIAFETIGSLLLDFIDSIVVNHIFLYLPLSPSMLWHLHKMRRTWFRVVSKCI